MIDDDELLDLVSENDEVISKLSRKEVYKNSLTNFRTINAFIINNDKQVWLPIRHSSKALWPNMLDASVGGHVSSGETYFDAFKRESAEELNLNILDFSWKILSKLSPNTSDVGSFMHVYVIYYNASKVNFNSNDFIDGNWFDLNFAKTLISKNPKIRKPDLVTLIEILIKLL